MIWQTFCHVEHSLQNCCGRRKAKCKDCGKEKVLVTAKLFPSFCRCSSIDETDDVCFVQDDMFDVAGDSIQHLMTLILVFMGSPQRIKNPHLRAELADMLAALIPSHKESSGSFAKQVFVCPV